MSARSRPALPSFDDAFAYETLIDVGSGGMGTIQLARARGEDDGFERLVAIKRAHAFVREDPEAFARFLDEARLAAQVRHANVVGIHRVGRDAEGPYLVLDYVEGDSLAALIDHAAVRGRKLPPSVVLRVLVDALSGLHAVHETKDAAGRPLEILHRDVAPQNLLVGLDGVTRLTDFGIAKGATSSINTDRAYLQGRLHYLAPEYLRREPVDRRLDVYAMGVTAYYALVGQLPWDDASEAQIVLHAVNDGVPSLADAGLTIAPALTELVRRASARAPEARFPSARAMLEAVEEVGRHTGWIASHAEVADLVLDLVGDDLAARRDAVAKLVRARRAEAESAEASLEPMRPNRRRLGLFGTGFALLVSLAIGLAARAGGKTITPKPLSSSAAIAPPSSLLQASDAPVVEVVPSSSPSDAVESPREAASSLPPPQPRASADLRVHRSAPPRRGISTANPYR